MTKNMLISWLEQNDALMEKAASLLAEGLIESLICDVKDLKDEPMLRNATDLAECDEHDLSSLLSLLDARRDISMSYDYIYGEVESGPYSIKEWNKKERGYGGVRDVFTSWLEDNYEEVLPEDVLKAVRERHDVACVVDANAYGGGGYEVLHDMYYEAKVKATEIIKRELSN